MSQIGKATYFGDRRIFFLNRNSLLLGSKRRALLSIPFSVSCYSNLYSPTLIPKKDFHTSELIFFLYEAVHGKLALLEATSLSYL